MSEYQNVNQSNFKNDECYINQQSQSNKSIFNYIIDSNMFINKNQCFDINPPFLAYIPGGSPVQNVDIESNLKGVVRHNTRCASCKYQPTNLNLTADGNSNKEQLNIYPHNKQLCSSDYQILPHGYNSRK
jgi:hypothetical protein